MAGATAVDARSSGRSGGAVFVILVGNSDVQALKGVWCGEACVDVAVMQRVGGVGQLVMKASLTPGAPVASCAHALHRRAVIPLALTLHHFNSQPCR